MRVCETCLYAEDLEAAYAFYVGLLGLKPAFEERERGLFLKCDDGMLIVFKASVTVVPDAIVPPHGTTGRGHMAFAATDAEIDEWKVRLADAGVPVTKEVQWENGARSIYFDDPAGNVLEFVTPRLWGF